MAGCSASRSGPIEPHCYNESIWGQVAPLGFHSKHIRPTTAIGALHVEPPLATLTLAVNEDSPVVPGYKLKLNSYDLGVDIELADAVTRLRFEHPEVRAVIITGGLDRVFCAGANIHMLATSTHGFKVNFCKYTNETRLAIEDACAHSGQHYIAACNGTTAGGGYELALACEEIYLVDDGNSAVSLPEVPLLGVLPGTGGLTRVVDKRKVRRDLADVFSTLAEGIKGKRAVEWRLVDGVFPRSRFQEAVRERALTLAAARNAAEARDWHRARRALARSHRERGTLPPRRTETEPRGPHRRTDHHGPEGAQPIRPKRYARRRRFLARCALSANSTTRCCGCASTTTRSAWSC